MELFNLTIGNKSENVHDYWKESFDQVMSKIQIPKATRKLLIQEYESDYESDPDKLELSLIQHLVGIEWKWAEFEYWEKIFLEKRTFPYMWWKYRDILMQLKDPLDHAEQVVKYLNVSELKKLLKNSDISLPKPIPQKRDELENLIICILTFEQIKSFAQAKIESKQIELKQRLEKERCRLLFHTIAMTGYSIRNFHLFHDDKKRVQFMALPSHCPVENEFVILFNQGKMKTLPPFFPGDRTNFIPLRKPV